MFYGKAFLFCCVISLLFTLGCASPRVFGPKEGPTYSEEHLDFKAWKRRSSCCSARGKKIAISSGGKRSSRIGLAIFEQGGNVVDVAVAVAFALAVERPQSAGLGGGGFMTLHLVKPKPTKIFVDFRETAPHLATQGMFLDENGNVMAGFSQSGAFSVATPGFVAGLYEIHKKWGKLKWSVVLEPAVKLAQGGFRIYPSLAKQIDRNKNLFSRMPYTKRLFFRGGQPLKAGNLLVQWNLGQVIDKIARKGRNAFYKGWVARKIASVIRPYGGILDEKDLANYKVKFREPVIWKWNDFTFISAPPPSAGGVMLAQMMGVLSTFDLKKESKSSGAYVHLLSEVMKRSFADRSVYVGDPDFVKVPIKGFYGKDRVEDIRGDLDLSEATPSEDIQEGDIEEETHGTTHLSVLDRKGNAVSSTITINGSFGSGIVVPGTGIVLNNEMDNFSVKPGVKNQYGLTGGQANAIAPNKRPVCSMSPTIVLYKDKPILVLGAAGGARIISSVFQTILNYLVVFSDDLKRSVFAPRMHHQWLPDKLELEEGYSDGILDFLKKMQHDISSPPYASRVSAVARQMSQNRLMAVFDPRDEGGVAAK